jgi:hypothetical protein
MATAMCEVKGFGHPDETRPFKGHGHVDVVEVGGRPVGLGSFEPGWHWHDDVRPIAGTDTCQVSHLGYCVSGHMRIHMDDGSEHDIGPGDAFTIPPGHDAEVLGDETCVLLEFGQAGQYAKA